MQQITLLSFSTNVDSYAARRNQTIGTDNYALEPISLLQVKTMQGRTLATSASHSLYDLLGVSPTATRREIKEQFYRLCLLYHPDRQAGATATSDQNEDLNSINRKFLQINHAYQVLSNEQDRKRYDETHGFNLVGLPSGSRQRQRRNLWESYPGSRHSTADFRSRSEWRPPSQLHRQFRSVDEHEAKWMRWTEDSESKKDKAIISQQKALRYEREKRDENLGRIGVILGVILAFYVIQIHIY